MLTNLSNRKLLLLKKKKLVEFEKIGMHHCFKGIFGEKFKNPKK
jgi:hypothetical protein